MSVLRRYRRFPTVPDSRALLALLRMHAIAFETRYERGESYGGRSHEPDRFEVWIATADYAQVKALETSLTPEQISALRDYDSLINRPDDELQAIVAQPAALPPEAAAAAWILRERKPYPAANATATPGLAPPLHAPSRSSTRPNKPLSKWLMGLLLFAAGLAAYLCLVVST